ncbi:MAG: hypothetical protein JST21_01105 [Bacteroidetes bacterium]|nr:hypothetical protein [Bacteroidota bacterium]
MPVEINELIIRANITSPDSPKQASLPVTDNEQKLQQILDEILKKLDEKEER